MNVAQTILTQLGGRKFQAMTGAKQFVAGTDYLQFKLPANFAKDGINCVKVTLTAADLYEVDFMKVRGLKVDTIAQVQGLYADQLQQTFTEKTGLDTRI